MEFNVAVPRAQALFGDVIAATAERPMFDTPPSPSPEVASAQAVAFLRQLDPIGWHNLVAIDPAGHAAVEGRTFAPGQFNQMADWIDQRDGTRNLYFSANEPKPNAPDKKLRKSDIGAVRVVYADVDLPAGVDVAAGLQELQRSLNALDLGDVPPTFKVDSGGGVQLVWRLDDRYDPDKFGDWAEAQGRAVADLVGGDRVQNVDRVLRLPGTLNIPTAAKTAKGRERRRSSVTAAHPGRIYSSAALSEAIAPQVISGATSITHSDEAKASAAIDFDEACSRERYTELPEDLRERFESACERQTKLASLWAGDDSALLGDDRTSSAWRAALAARLSQLEGFDAQDYANLVWVWPKAVQDKIDHRQLARDWAKYGAPNVAGRERILSYFEEPTEQPTESHGPAPDVFKTLTLADIFDMPDPVFVIDRHIPEKSLGFLYGEPGAKKSFIALDWALHLVYDRDEWHGDAIRTKAGGVVLYLAGEGAAGMKKRARAWLQHNQIAADDPKGLRFHLLPHAVNLMSVDEVKKLARTLRVSIGAPIAAVIVDTVSRAVPGADENLQKEMTRFVQSCDFIKQEFECIVVGVHHASHNGKMRGSTVLQGAGDFVFRVDVKKGALAGRLVCEKQKDAPDGWGEPYRFDVVPLGDGSSSLVPVRAVGAGKAQFTPEVEQQILDAITADWDAGAPWAVGKQSRERWAPRRLHLEFGFPVDEAERIVDHLVQSKSIEIAQLDRKTKRRGYRQAQAERTERQDSDGVFA